MATPRLSVSIALVALALAGCGGPSSAQPSPSGSCSVGFSTSGTTVQASGPGAPDLCHKVATFIREQGDQPIVNPHPVEIDGVERSYVEVTKNGNYDHNELKLVGNTTTYTLNKGAFHPTLPDSVWKNGKMQIWVDQDSTAIIAITLYDEQDQNPIKYTTPTGSLTVCQDVVHGLTYAVTQDSYNPNGRNLCAHIVQLIGTS